MFTDQRKQLKEIKSFDELVNYLRDPMGWPIENADFEELTFEYTPEELGIDASNAAKIQEIKRLRPLVPNQPWGIFFVKFEPKRLPIVALRRILSRVALKKRTSANKPERQAWAANDLLFVSNFGEGEGRQISFAHFSVQKDRIDLPTLKVLGWDNLDTALHLDDVAERLTSDLAWPENDTDEDAWRQQWQAAFSLRYREVITTSQQLSEHLAELARNIRDRIKSALSVETETGPLTELMNAFQVSLVHDIDANGFADMYAQTIAYGLLSARIADPSKKTIDDFANHMRTNPFLKELMEAFINVGGRRGKAGGPGIDFDELGASEVVDLLDQANMEAVVSDFGDRNPLEDPVIHFYEHFLASYDKRQKVSRGVFYTPRPVVSYIVRSVDELLRTEFGLGDGLADTTTWGQMAKRHEGLEIPNGTSPDQAFVQILDPATGTGTFLVEAIDLIHETMVSKWKAQGLSNSDIEAHWNDYVPSFLLPRLHGYELLMAPYAIAHLKVGLKLFETGYRFGSEERARVYLTNALEQASDKQQRLSLLPALARESKAVNEVKRFQRFTVLIGNPPYSASISEPEWLMKKMENWKQGLNEKKSDLNREEWKFLRLAQHHCTESGTGIVGFIINRDFLDGIAKRRMREHLGQSFTLRIAVDLNGDVKGNVSDENVFEIAQGVAIAVLCTRHSSSELRFTSRVGTRAQKYADLIAKEPIDGNLAAVDVSGPYYRWVPYLSDQTAAAETEYTMWPQIRPAFEVASSGIQTKRDGLCISFSRDEMWKKIQRFHSLTPESAREEFGLGSDGRDWTVEAAKNDVASSGPDQKFLCPILYRPFDIRFTYWTGKTKGFLAYPRRDVMQHVIGHKNMGLIFNRQIVGDNVSHFGVSRIPICHGTFYLGNKGQDYFAPLFKFSDDLLGSKKTGSSNIVATISTLLRKTFDADDIELSPEIILNYAYAVFHSPSFRNRYAEFLKLDFPRLPLTGNMALFRELANLGGELVDLHLLESSTVNQQITEYIGGDSPEVEKVTWSNGSVWINDIQTIGFRGISEEVWKFHVGGYQVCEKWLKDRQAKSGKTPRSGRKLTPNDLAHYQKIVVALSETIRLMQKIDDVVETHGGWPGAFIANMDKG